MEHSTSAGAHLRAIKLFSLLVLIVGRQVASNGQQASPSGQEASSSQQDQFDLIEADQNGLYILGLFDVHSSQPRQPFRCGPIESDSGERQSKRAMQNLAAFRWAVEQVNNDAALLPGVRLGALSMDTCSSPLRTNQQVANLLHGRAGTEPARNLVGLVADQADAHSLESTVSMASALGLTTFISQARSSRLSELARKYQQPASLALANLDPASEAAAAELLLGELLGIGRMMTSTPEPALQALSSSSHQQRLLMVRMRASNEVLAEAIVSLLHKMHWHFISLVYEADDPEMVDLHDELVRQLFHRGFQLALDEQVSLALADNYERLVQQLAKKSELGARVVVSLVGAGSARALLEAQQRLRKDSSSGAPGSLVWITVADREPFYSMATEALGTIAVSSSSPLIGEFRSFYEQLPMGSSGKRSTMDRWWSEYMRSVLSQGRPDLGSSPLSECTKWALRNQSLDGALDDKCSHLTLAGLASAQPIIEQAINGSGALPARQVGASRYLAAGWEHNGMDTINAVLAIANGLEALRQALCPDTKSGLCERMQALLTAQSKDQQQVTLSELLYNELFRSTFQLADGRMFNLDEASGQLDCKVKFYNLRYLQPNSIGFVKFATFDPNSVDGFTLNATKARYPKGNLAYQDQESLDKLKSACEHESKCLMGASGDVGDKSPSISEEELAAGVNSLFKLDHPLISAPFDFGKLESSAAADQDERVQSMRSLPVGKQVSSAGKQPAESASTFDTIVLLPLHKGKSGAHQSSADGQLLQAANCSDRMDIERSFQRLVALAYAQNLANAPAPVQALAAAGLDEAKPEQVQIKLTTTVIDYCEQTDLARAKLAQLLSSRRQTSTSGSDLTSNHVAVIDFDRQVSKSIHGLAREHQLLHLSLGVGGSDSASEGESLLVSLMPTKVAEIAAIVALISSMPQWKLVHLIYTDQHSLRDEFVRRANEANICVSKLIWVPPLQPDTDKSQADKQVESLAGLFQRELHEYSSMSSRVEGLNSTRVLVILASDSAEANQLIMEASSESMRRDYIWLTSHEWLTSVELPAQRLTSIEAPQSRLPSRLPRYFLSTSLETFESHDFRRFMAALSPSIHTPIPTSWFDEFWQQNFQCRLPLGQGSRQASTTRTCSPDERLEAHQVVEDDRVHYTIQALESIYAALLATAAGSRRPATALDKHLFVGNFKRAFERSRQLSSDGGDAESTLASKPYGFNIVLRLLPDRDPAEPNARRPNSRAELALDAGLEEPDYLAGGGQLLRVGLWRAGHLLMLNRDNATANSWLRRDVDSSLRAIQEENTRVSRSLSHLGAIRSRCSGSPSCSLCNRQIEQTQTLIRQEEARLNLSWSLHEPRALSSILLANPKLSQQSILDNPDQFSARFDDELLNGEQKDDIQASASSLFNSDTSKQLANHYQSEVHWVRAHLMQPTRSHNQDLPGQAPLAATLLSLAGMVCMFVCLAYFYPNKLAGRGSDKMQSLFARQEDKLACNKPNNLADYLALTGLLMLYSINVAFLLQADVNVCWFRRIGLGASYAMVLSSILMRTIFCLRRAKLYSRNSSMPSPSRVELDHCQQLDLAEENVEMTFESLPHDQAQSNEAPNMMTSAYQNAQPLALATKTYTDDDRNTGGLEPTSSTLPLVLVSSQMLIAILWLWNQPPEPTLYRHCWHCASPRRSPILFLYEPLLSLLFPASLLSISWLLSLLAYWRISTFQPESSLDLETSPKPLSIGQEHARKELQELTLESKALVMSTTLLVFTWTVVSLSMISPGQQTAQNISPTSGVRVAQSSATETSVNLVYANILSGAIIFAFIFVYRLNLFAGSWTRLAQACRRSTSSNNSTSQTARAHSATNPVLKFNQQTTNNNSRTIKCPDNNSQPNPTTAYADDSIFTGSQFSTSGRQERLKLQQFHSYGTYAPTQNDHVYQHGSSHIVDSNVSSTSALSFSSIATSLVERSNKIYRSASTAKRSRHSDLTNSSETTNTDISLGRRSSPSIIFGSIGKRRNRNVSVATNPKSKADSQASSGTKLQRHQSSGSVASSTAKLVHSISGCDDDNISYASSIASSSASQLQGNDLYPIDCSIQLDTNPPTQSGKAMVTRSETHITH